MNSNSGIARGNALLFGEIPDLLLVDFHPLQHLPVFFLELAHERNHTSAGVRHAFLGLSTVFDLAEKGILAANLHAVSTTKVDDGVAKDSKEPAFESELLAESMSLLDRPNRGLLE